MSLNNLNISSLQLDDKWLILNGLLKDFKITESNGILVCTGSYLVDCSIGYEETNYYKKEVSFDSLHIEYQIFKDIETNKMQKAYTDKYIEEEIQSENTLNEICNKRYKRVSELKKKYTILNPYNSSKNSNGFNEVKKDFFLAAIEKGQTKAKQLVLEKYPHLK